MLSAATQRSVSASSPRPLTAPAGYRRHKRFHTQILLFLDMLVGVAMVPVAMRCRNLLPQLHGPMTMATILVCGEVLLLTAVIAWLLYRNASWRAELAVARPVIMATLISFASLFLLRSTGDAVSRPTVLIFSVLVAVGMLAMHHLGAYWQSYAALRAPVPVVLVGSEEQLAAAKSQFPGDSRWHVCGTFPNSPTSEVKAQQHLEELHQMLRSQNIEEVLLLSDPFDANPEQRHFLHRVISLCGDTATTLRFWADWVSDRASVYVDHWGQSPVLTVSFKADASWPVLAKRAMDLVVGGALLLTALPLLMLAGLAVRLDSKGPVIFSQLRGGQRGRPFRVYKLRTMRVDAEALRPGLAALNEVQGPAFKITRDPRITRVGAWLRKTSIDELPQLLNVLRGDMSLVGPRPCPIEEVQQYAAGHLKRLAMKPGITGLWQVSGRSAIIAFDQWVELDAQYMACWSLWLDCKILCRTVWVVLRLSGK